MDDGIKQESLCVSFCLKLHQSSHDSPVGDIVAISTPMKAHVSSKVTLGSSSVSVDLDSAFPGAATTTYPITSSSNSSKITSGPSSKLSSTPTPSPVPKNLAATLKISQLLGLHTGGSSNVTIYFGPMSILDDQPSFQSVFGLKPLLLSSTPPSLKENCTRDVVYGYAEKCIFDIFLTIVRLDYVGTDSAVSEGKMIHEICKKISNLKWSINHVMVTV